MFCVHRVKNLLSNMLQLLHICALLYSQIEAELVVHFDSLINFDLTNNHIKHISIVFGNDGKLVAFECIIFAF